MNEKVTSLRVVGASLITSFIAMKMAMPYFTKIKIKTSNNQIILGKWHRKTK